MRQMKITMTRRIYVDYKVNERIGVQFGGQIVKRTYSSQFSLCFTL